MKLRPTPVRSIYSAPALPVKFALLEKLPVFVLTSLELRAFARLLREESTLTKKAPPSPNSQGVTPLESTSDFAKSFRSRSCGKCPCWLRFSISKTFRINRQFAKFFKAHSYEKTPRKSFRAHSYKIIRLKVICNHTLAKKGGGMVLFPTQPARTHRETPADSRPYNPRLGPAILGERARG
jgi:hypothetical protein